MMLYFEYPKSTTRGHSEPVKRVPFKDGEPTAVWAVCVGKDCTQREGESIVDFARRAEWAKVFSVEQVEKKK